VQRTVGPPLQPMQRVPVGLTVPRDVEPKAAVGLRLRCDTGARNDQQGDDNDDDFSHGITLPPIRRAPMSIRRICVLAAVAALAFLTTQVTHAQQAPAVKRTVLLQHDTSAPGFEAVLVAVEIPVGGREGRHFHSGTAMIHVTDGAITLDYEGKPTVRYK